jgi:epoxyqueuosine reductase
LSGLKARLAARGARGGFSKMGICRPDAIPQAAERLAAFVAKGRHGQMAWMAERMHWRGDPTALWPEARSVIMLAEAYTPGKTRSPISTGRRWRRSASTRATATTTTW